MYLSYFVNFWPRMALSLTFQGFKQFPEDWSASSRICFSGHIKVLSEGELFPLCGAGLLRFSVLYLLELKCLKLELLAKSPQHNAATTIPLRSRCGAVLVFLFMLVSLRLSPNCCSFTKIKL